MTTYAHLIYLCLDELKGFSDDFSYTEDHVMFLLTKYRGLLIKQNYKDIKKEIPESNFQTICIDLIPTPSVSHSCDASFYLRSEKKIPYLMNIVNPSIYVNDFYKGNLTYVSMERMKYVGHNKWMSNIIYCSIGPDNHLYLKSMNPQFMYLKKANLTGIFENPEEASKLDCNKDEDVPCNIKDRVFPIEEALVPQLVQLVVKELSGSVYRPKDPINSASDDLATMAQYIRNNMKSNMQKQIDGNNE